MCIYRYMNRYQGFLQQEGKGCIGMFVYICVHYYHPINVCSFQFKFKEQRDRKCNFLPQNLIQQRPAVVFVWRRNDDTIGRLFFPYNLFIQVPYPSPLPPHLLRHSPPPTSPPVISVSFLRCSLSQVWIGICDLIFPLEPATAHLPKLE